MNIYNYFLLINPNSLSSLFGIYYIRLYKGFVISKFFFSIYSIVYIISSLYTFFLFVCSFKSVYFFSISFQHRSFWCHYKLSHHVHIAGYYAHRRWIWMVAKCLPAWASVQWPSASLHIHIHKHRHRHLVSWLPTHPAYPAHPSLLGLHGLLGAKIAKNQK